MNLVIDIGNTAAKLALFEGDDLVGEVMRTDNHSLSGLSALVASHPTIRRAILSTVVRLSDNTLEIIDNLPFPVLKLQPSTPLPIPASFHFPTTMGSDRIADDVAAIIGAAGHPALVIDAGTCLTAELLHPEHGFMGGIISPGVRLRLLAMHEHTDALPLVSRTATNDELLGHDTEGNMLLGATNGVTFEIEGYIRRLTAKYHDLVVFITGGYTFSLDNSIKSPIIQDKLLLLRGLNHILNFNEA